MSAHPTIKKNQTPDLEVGDDARILHALDSLRGEDARQVGIHGETLPIPPSEGCLSQRTSDRAQCNVCYSFPSVVSSRLWLGRWTGSPTSFDAELIAYFQASPVREALVPARADMNPARIGVGQVHATDSVAGVHETQSRPSKARHAARGAMARIGRVGDTVCDVNFLLQGHLADQSPGGGIGRCPDAGALALGCTMSWQVSLARSGPDVLAGIATWRIHSREGYTGGDWP